LFYYLLVNLTSTGLPGTSSCQAPTHSTLDQRTLVSENRIDDFDSQVKMSEPFSLPLLSVDIKFNFTIFTKMNQWDFQALVISNFFISALRAVHERDHFKFF
jgi:hypothetical protein